MRAELGQLRDRKALHEAEELDAMITQLRDYAHPLSGPSVAVMRILTECGRIAHRDDLFDQFTHIMDNAENIHHSAMRVMEVLFHAPGNKEELDQRSRLLDDCLDRGIIDGSFHNRLVDFIDRENQIRAGYEIPDGVRVLTEGIDVSTHRVEAPVSGWMDQGDGSFRAPQEMEDDFFQICRDDELRRMRKKLARACANIGIDSDWLFRRVRKAHRREDFGRRDQLFAFFMGMLLVDESLDIDTICCTRLPRI